MADPTADWSFGQCIGWAAGGAIGCGVAAATLDFANSLGDFSLIVFVSDNGGERFSNNWPFVGGKMDLLEGGIRVPQIAWWPAGIKPGYQQLDVNAELSKGGLVPIASGRGHEAAISIHQRGAVLWGARLSAGESVVVPDDAHVHVFVALGSAELETGDALAQGAAARLTDAGSLRVTAGEGGAELLVWATT